MGEMAGTDDVDMVRLWQQPSDVAERLCQRFYDEVYRACFPRADETEDPTIWLPLMLHPPAGTPRVFIILACQRDQAAPVSGGIVFEHYRGSGDWLATYIAVHPSARRTGIARTLVAAMIETIAQETAASVWQLYAEAEDPTRLPDDDQAMGWKRLSALSALGFRWIQIDYVQPALGPAKREVADLLLLCWQQQPTSDVVSTPARLDAFLREFYQANDQPGASSLASMSAELARIDRLPVSDLPRTADNMPARYDHILGTAHAVTLRLTFISFQLSPLPTGPRQGRDIAEIALNEIRPLDPSHRNVAAARMLSDPFASFHADITVPFASASSMPVILQCEPFRSDPAGEPGSCSPPIVRIAFPPELRTRWEGEIRTTRFSADEQGDWVVEARFIDSVAFYESGYIAYSVAFVFGIGDHRLAEINAAAILAVASLAGAAGQVVGSPVRMALDGEAPCTTERHAAAASCGIGGAAGSHRLYGVHRHRQYHRQRTARAIATGAAGDDLPRPGTT